MSIIQWFTLERIATLSLIGLLGLTFDLLSIPTWFTPAPHKLARQAQLPLKSPLIEISGMTRHLARPHHYWVHNDSLDQARMFLVNHHGKLISEHHVTLSQRGLVNNIDWEDITSTGHDVYEGDRVLYVADSGNNFHWRDDLKVYAFSEPKTDHEPLSLLRTYAYRFPYQSRHPPQNYSWRDGRCLDSEALFWWRDELFLISKCVFGGPTLLWRLPREELIPSGELTGELTLKPTSLLPIQPAPHPLSERVTGASIDLTSNILAVLTYRSVWFFHLSGSPQTPQVRALFRCALSRASAQPVQQAEAIEWSVHQRPDIRGQRSTLRSLLILTEGRGVHTLSVDFSSQECPHESTTL